MSYSYQELKDDLLKIPTLKDKVVEIDENPNLTEDEKCAELAELLCRYYIDSAE